MSATEIMNKKISNSTDKALRALYGSDHVELIKQTKRYASLSKQFNASFGSTSVQFFSSPGRTEIGGNHTDHNYGRVLAGGSCPKQYTNYTH
jgi:galactokinase